MNLLGFSAENPNPNHTFKNEFSTGRDPFMNGFISWMVIKWDGSWRTGTMSDSYSWHPSFLKFGLNWIICNVLRLRKGF